MHKKITLLYLTLIILLLGLIITLSILKENPTGYSILKNQEPQLNITTILELINFPGEKINIPLIIQNTGNIPLTNCKLSVIGEIENWIYSNQTENITPNKEKQINLEINIPQQINPKTYLGNLEITCNEKQITQELKIKVPSQDDILKINKINIEKNNLNLNYEFDNSNIIGEKTSIKIKILNQNNIEIANYTDTFKINKNPPINRNLSIMIPKGTKGIFNIELSMYPHPEISIKQSIIFGNSITTGNTILEKETNNLTGYLFFIGLIFTVILVFLYRNIKYSKKRKYPLNKTPPEGFEPST